MTTSVFFANLAWVLLFANWVFEWNWKEKFADFRHNYLLQACLVLVAVHLLWLIGNDNVLYGLHDCRKKLPLLAIPLVILSSPSLNHCERSCLGVFYVGTIIVVSFIGLVRWLTMPDLPYRSIVPYISHIRFGMNICLALVILVYWAFKRHRLWTVLTASVMALWLMLFLMIIHSYTAFIILLVTAMVLVLVYRCRLPKGTRIAVISSLSAVIVLCAGLISYYCYDYFHLRPLSTQPVVALTSNGNPYTHSDDDLIENGNYVHRYVCEEEMRREWAKLSKCPIDSITSVGYPIYPALLRYLNGMGVTKDSLGMTHLTAEDVRAIEKGIANPVYLNPGPRKMVYVLCYEYENHRCYHNVSNFSMLQRLELWKNAWHVLWQHPLLGVGTGDVVDACHQRLREIHSPLADTEFHTHDQYLTFLVSFGWFGFLLIVFFFVRAICRTHSCHSLFFTAFLCIVLVSFVSEDTLETLAGILFVSLGYSLLARRNESKPQHEQLTE